MSLFGPLRGNDAPTILFGGIEPAAGESVAIRPSPLSVESSEGLGRSFLPELATAPLVEGDSE